MSTLSEPRWFTVAKCEDIPVREGRRVLVAGQEIALFNLGEEGFFAIEHTCPHARGPLADGMVAGKTVYCPLHNWQLSLESGEVLSGGTGRVKAFPTKTEGGQVLIALKP